MATKKKATTEKKSVDSKKLAEKGLTNITHFGPMYRFRIMAELGYDENAIAETCPNTEKMFYSAYTHLPLYPLTREQLEYQAAAVVEAVRELVTEGKYHIPERRLLAIMTAILDEWPVLEGDSSGDLPLFYAMFAAGRQWGINERRDAEARAKTWFELS